MGCDGMDVQKRTEYIIAPDLIGISTKAFIVADCDCAGCVHGRDGQPEALTRCAHARKEDKILKRY